jgi:hypothetical protein
VFAVLQWSTEPEKAHDDGIQPLGVSLKNKGLNDRILVMNDALEKAKANFR